MQNPVSESFADTYADPAVIRGKDGWWYVYATSDPLEEGDSPFGLMHVARTKDFVDWSYVGNVFDSSTRPAWATSSSFFWAPDIRYLDGEYVMYYTVTDTTANADPWDFAIGAATAPTPAGPWTDSGGPVVAPRPTGGGGFFGTIDPAMFTDDDGTPYLYFGGFHGGLWVTELSPDGMHAVGSPTQVAHGDRYEGSYVVKHGAYYYLTASSANCCAGPTTGYSVYAGRSTSPLGPFVDHEGVPLLDSRVGGTQVIAQNGNRWIGPGHHAFLTDLSGQDFIVYHALDRHDAWLNDPGGINERPTLMDRLDWIDGWPVARAGAGPSDAPVPAPVTSSGLGITSSDPASNDALGASSGDWLAGTDTEGDAGALARLVPSDGRALATTRAAAPRDVRLSADVRFAADGTFTAQLAGVDVSVDLAKRSLSAGRSTSSLPASFDGRTWTELTVEVRAGRMEARLSESGLGDALAEVSVSVRHQQERPVTLAASGAEVHVDNLAVVKAHKPVTKHVREPSAGRTLFTDEFKGSLGDGWTWVRPDSSVNVGSESLDWPLASVDVVGTANTGALLMRDAPAGTWIAETKLHLDLGTDTIRNYQQAGLIVRVDDDNFLRLGDVSIWGTRQVEFGKELQTGSRLDWGAHLGGPTAETMWLRIFHRVDPDSGEHVYRSASSRDGSTWRWGATWTLPARTSAQVGLYAGGGASPAVVASFDYFRFMAAR